jgi:hypothetical protein
MHFVGLSFIIIVSNLFICVKAVRYHVSLLKNLIVCVFLGGTSCV